MSRPADSAEERLARKRSLSRRRFAYRLLGAGGLIVLTFAIGRRPELEFAEILSGLAAMVAAVGALDAGIRAYRINVGSPRRPNVVPSTLPDERSSAFAPLVRLAARERELADYVSALPSAVSGDTWRQASAAARTLRIHAARITAAEGSPIAATAVTKDVDLLASRLREGVSAYERLTVTAGELVAEADSKTSGNATVRLADATDALVGMTRGLAS
ncbi:MAG: hypothetical protein M3400_00980 [Actinomycetota bacterium]|nr:hypothetical protein [Actinomycetota bacterium]